MNPVVRNILAVIAGAIVGSIVNGLIVGISGSIIPLPEGANTATIEGLNESMNLFETKHFLMPFFAHAIGTLFGATLAAYLGASRKMLLGLIVGGLFFVGGVYMVSLLSNSPMWFNVLDLAVAYFPMGWLGYKIATAIGKK